MTFGRLTVSAESEIRGRRRVYWKCRCECGSEKWVIADALKAGCTKSCGCLHDEGSPPKHGHNTLANGQSPEYKAWHCMKQRCMNLKHKRYPIYGGRGITVCEPWHDFANFLADMGTKPSSKHSIDRIDNNRGYEPGNCRWATTAEQNRNLRRNRFFTFQGETLCLADWVKRTGIPHATLHYRLKRWPIERALTEPPQQQ